MMDNKNIINLFGKDSDNIESYSSILKFQVILIFIIVVSVFTRLFYNSKNQVGNQGVITILKGIFVILLIFFGLYISNNYITMVDSELNNQNKLLDFKLYSLQQKVYVFIDYKVDLINSNSVNNGQVKNDDVKRLYNKNKLDSLYIDANMINFLYSIIDLYEYNPNEFYLLLKGTNNILKIRKSMETEPINNIQELFEIAIQLKANVQNNIQNFIYSVPKNNEMYKYIDNIIFSYTVLINKNLDMCNKYTKEFQKTNGINTYTKFVNYKMTKEFDEMNNHSILPHKGNNKLIDLYI